MIKIAKWSPVLFLLTALSAASCREGWVPAPPIDYACVNGKVFAHIKEKNINMWLESSHYSGRECFK